MQVAAAWYLPLLKIGVDQTLWTVVWNSTYYGLLGVLRGESPTAISDSVRSSWLDLMRAGWRLWPLAHLVTYGLLPQEHRYAPCPSRHVKLCMRWVSGHPAA